MRKAIIACLVLAVIAITINTNVDITGMFVKVASAFEDMVRAVVKDILQAIANAI